MLLGLNTKMKTPAKIVKAGKLISGHFQLPFASWAHRASEVETCSLMSLFSESRSIQIHMVDIFPSHIAYIFFLKKNFPFSSSKPSSNQLFYPPATSSEEYNSLIQSIISSYSTTSKWSCISFQFKSLSPSLILSWENKEWFFFEGMPHRDITLIQARKISFL